VWKIYGQDHILRQLEPSLRQARLGHAYLLIGPPHVGKMTLALQLAQAVNCEYGPGIPCSACTQCLRIAQGIHAAVRVIGVEQREEGEPTRTVIGIDEIKSALRQVNLKAYEGNCSVIIFDHAESMSEAAANALLKTLEEPPPQVLIMLLAEDEESLLPTLRSRCRLFTLLPVPKVTMVEKLISENHTDPATAERLAILSRGCLGWAVTASNEPQILEQLGADLERIQETYHSGLEVRFNYAAELATRFSRDREPVKQLLFLWLRWWRDLLLLKEGAEDYVQNLDCMDQLLNQAAHLTTGQVVDSVKRLPQTLEGLDSNANPRLALEVLMLNLPTETATPGFK